MTCVADLQDPPELIPQFVQKWEEGYKVVIGVKRGSRDSWLMSRTRKFYYWLVGRLSSDVELVHNFTGFGLYDRDVVEQFRSTDEQYPYFRGLVSDFGYARAVIDYVQPARTRGHTKNDFFSLYDIAMLGITNHSKVPLRLATMAGFAISVVSLLVAFGYLVAKLMFWDQLQLGLAPLLIGIYFFGAVQLFFIGVLGEYIGAIHTQVHKRPLVVEKGADQLRLAQHAIGGHCVQDRLPTLVAISPYVHAVVGSQRTDQERDVPEILGPVIEADSEDGRVGSNGPGAADDCVVFGALDIELDVRGLVVGEQLIQWRDLDRLSSGSHARPSGPGGLELEGATMRAYGDGLHADWTDAGPLPVVDALLEGTAVDGVWFDADDLLEGAPSCRQERLNCVPGEGPAIHEHFAG